MKMMEDCKKSGSSPFVGFRVIILNAERARIKTRSGKIPLADRAHSLFQDQELTGAK
jgi:hypothetical protein